MKKAMAALVVLAMVAVTAVAQDVERQRDRGRRDNRRGRGPSISRLVEELKQQLQFDDEQLAQIDELVAAHEERMQENRAQWREVQTARDAGDEDRAAELREQLRAQRGERGQGIEALLDKIEPILHEEQREAFQQIRARMSQQRDRGDRDLMRQIARELPDAVEMTDEQRAEFEALLTEQRAIMRERMRDQRPPRREGDDAEQTPRRGRADVATMYDKFFEQVAEILNEDQLGLLADYRARIEAERRSGRQGTDDVRAVLSAAKRVRGLSSDQKDSLREIETKAMQSYRELRRDAEGQAQLAAEVKAKIVKLLDDDQNQEFERNLDRLQSRERRGEREPRGRRDRESRDRDRPEKP
jgi:hypothetical protein